MGLESEHEVQSLGDAHCHLSTEMTLDQVGELISRIETFGGRKHFFKLMSTNHIDLEIVGELSSVDQVQGYFGIHPWYSHLFTDLDHSLDDATLKETHYNQILTPKPTPDLLEVLPTPINIHQHLKKIETLCTSLGGCIGEIGLDKLFRIPTNGFYGNTKIPEAKLSPCRVSMDHQLKVFNAQMALANRLQVPVSLHCVKAHGPLYDNVKTFDKIPQIVLHSFSGSVDQAKRWVKDYRKLEQALAFSFSYYINGIPEKRAYLGELLLCLSDEQILIETDISIDKHLGKDYTDHLEGVCAAILEIKGWNSRQLHTIMNANLHTTL